MTSQFSFNFQINDNDDATTTSTGGIRTLTAAEQQQQQQESAKNNNNDPQQQQQQQRKVAFKWIDTDYVKALLLERSQEEMVFTDLSLSTAQDVVQDERSSLSNSTCDTAVTVKNTIRCVDLTESSYVQPSVSSTGMVDAHHEQQQQQDQNYDILPGIYEGGRKVWECSCDLVQYLFEQNITLHNSHHQCTDTHHRRLNVDVDADADDSQSVKNDHHDRPMLFALELGCGHGLPGCYILQNALLEKDVTNEQCSMDDNNDESLLKHFTVVFTDYNESVLLDATISNIVLNCNNNNNNDDDDINTTISAVADHVVLGGGDWMDMSQQMQEQLQQRATDENHIDPYDTNEENVASPTGSIHCSHHNTRLPMDGYYDMILSAETIYTAAAAYDTALLLRQHLRPNSGVAYIATKRYYFGVGGGIDVFRDHCERVCQNENDEQQQQQPLHKYEQRNVQLLVQTVQVIDNGTGNIREILRVRKSVGVNIPHSL